MRRGLLFFISLILVPALGADGAAQAYQISGLTAITAAQQSKKIEDNGDIKIVYELPGDPQFLEIRQALKQSEIFDLVAASLNEELALPRNLLARFAECGKANAFYDRGIKTITMCYELIRAIAGDFSRVSGSDEEQVTATISTVLFVFFHELGHALIDILKLPVTGKEEDAVDQLASLMLIESGDEGEEAALVGAVWFLLQAEKTGVDDLAFWDEHSLDAQRFFNIACWVYGRNPNKHSDLVTRELLPQSRAARCVDEYRQMSASWMILLSPYLKK